MGSELFILIGLSFPIFYIWGIVSFVKLILGKSDSTTSKEAPNTQEIERLQKQVDGLNNVLHELELLAKENPNKPAGEILAEIQGSIPTPLPLPATPTKIASIPLETKNNTAPSTPTKQQSSWYDDNSINLLLYVGAFLVIAAASIFVGFSWEVIDGVLKALLLTLVAVGFFGSGLQLYKSTKTRSAGTTFTAIGALLIPFCGLGWHNFAFYGSPETAGITWCVTSLIAIGLYIYLAFKFSNKYYSYAASIASISLTLSSVKMFTLDQDFYILMGILSSYIMLGVSLYKKPQNEKEQELISRPLELTAYISLPISLTLGLLIAIASDKLFTFQAVLSCLLATIFYTIAYYNKNVKEYFAATIFLAEFTLFLFTRWSNLTTINTLYVLSITAGLFMFTAYYYSLKKKLFESDVLLFFAQTVMVLVFLVSVTQSILKHDMIFGILNIITSLCAAIIKKQAKLALTATIFSLFLPIIYLTRTMFGYKEIISTLSLIYLTFGSLGFSYIYLRKEFSQSNPTLYTILVSTVLWLTAAFATSVVDIHILMTTACVIALISYFTAYKYDKDELYYVAQIMTVISAFAFLRNISISTESLPYIFTPIAIVWYGISTVTKDKMSRTHEISAKVLALLTPFTTLILNDAYATQKLVEINALMSLDIAVVLFGYDAYLKRSSNNAYITSGIALVAMLWHFKTMGIQDSIFYTLTIGTYFMILGYFKRLQQASVSEAFDYIGMTVLILPTLALISTNGSIYSLLLLVIGVTLTGYGISTTLKRLKYGGITAIALAVLIETSSILFSLPWWLILGLVGGGFLYAAVYLLNKRK